MHSIHAREWHSTLYAPSRWWQLKIQSIGYILKINSRYNCLEFRRIPKERIIRQIDGSTMKNAEVTALVEINLINVLDKIKQGLLDNALKQ